ncbi:MAG: preprotein translocase subunit SecE [Clostridia bacterium]|nr:preprotein translocase subunit SecE [Clostridia bacterium]
MSKKMVSPLDSKDMTVSPADLPATTKKEVKEKNNKKNNNKKNNKENGFVRFFKRIGKGCKEVVSELKKVTWPTFAKTMAQTGIVLIVVVFFLVVVAAFDFGLTALFELLVK